MWAVRRSSTSIRCQALSKKTFHAFCTRTEISSYDFEGKGGLDEPSPVTANRNLYVRGLFSSVCNASRSFVGIHNYSSHAGTKSSGEEEDELEDGFSELETPLIAATGEGSLEDESDTELISEEDDEDDIGDEPQNDMELSDIEAEVGEKITKRSRASSGLFKVIMDAPVSSFNEALDKWVKEGNEVTSTQIATTTVGLRKRRLYGRALQLSEWLESSKQIELSERDYASRLDLIAKVRGLYKAESYIERIPQAFKGEVIYRTLLANCVSANNSRKAEEVFNKMKDLKFKITAFTCNQLLLLYKRIDKKKIADVLLLMEREDIKPTIFTYKILIDTKGQSNDLGGMEQIIDTMKAEGIEPDNHLQAILARHYVSAGLKEKAEAVLKEMEGENLNDNRWACSYLLPLHASLGNTDDVERIWKVCEANPRVNEFMAAIESWGKLKKIEEAEKVFSLMSKRYKNMTSKHYSIMLKVYANHKMLAKGKELVNQMGESGIRIGPLTWDALVKLYVEAGEIEKADSILQKAAQNSRVKPMFNTYITIMDKYSKRGDIHNTEKLFHRMRQVGYVSRLRQFQVLIQAYIIAKAPAYGIRERMKADNIFPNKGLSAQLAQVDAFKRTAVSDLLE